MAVIHRKSLLAVILCTLCTVTPTAAGYNQTISDIRISIQHETSIGNVPGIHPLQPFHVNISTVINIANWDSYDFATHHDLGVVFTYNADTAVKYIAPPPDSGVTYIAGGEVDIAQYSFQSVPGDNSLEFTFLLTNNTFFTSGAQEFEITLKVDLMFDWPVFSYSPGRPETFFTMEASALTGNSSRTATLTSRTLGPQLSVSHATNVDVVEGGSTLIHDISLSHTIFSTEAASDLLISITTDAVTRRHPFVNGSQGVYYVASWNTPTRVYFYNADGATYTAKSALAVLNETEAVFVHLEQDLGYDVTLGDVVPLFIEMAYYGNTSDSRAFPLRTQLDLATAVPSAKISIHDVTGHDVTAFLAGNTYSFSVVFGVPLGSLENLRVVGYFESEDLGVLGLTFTSATLTMPIQLAGSRPSIVTIDTFSSVHSNKRAAGGRMTLTGALGNWQNSFTSGANATLESASVSVGAILDSLAGLAFLVYVLAAIRGNNGMRRWAPVIAWLIPVELRISDDIHTGHVLSNIGLAYGASTQNFVSSTVPTLAPTVNLAKYVAVEDNNTIPTRVRFTSDVEHAAGSVMAANDVKLTDGHVAFDVFFGEGFIGPPLNDLQIQDDKVMTWQKATLEANETMLLSYVAAPNDALPDGVSNYTSHVTFKWGTATHTLTANVCVEKLLITTESFLYNYGFTALAVICGLLVGAGLVILIVFIVYKVRRKMPFESEVGPVRAIDSKVVRENTRSAGLITKVKKGAHAMAEFSGSLFDESIVFILSMKDRLRAFRQMDTWDISGTQHVDQDIERERNAAMLEASRLLVHNLQLNGDLPKGVAEKALSDLQKKSNQLDKDLDSTFQKDMETIFRRISTKNKDKMGRLLEKHQEETEELEEKTRGLIPGEKNQVMTLLKKQQEAEVGELGSMLELEQKEELEKLRKETAIRKRMELKGIQQDMLDQVKAEGQLSTEQAAWLMKEHFNNQTAVEKLYDNEISRQRMALEEKLAKRRALAEAKELSEDHASETLNALVTQQMQLLKKDKSGNFEMEMRKLQEELLASKEKLDAEREKQETALHKKLSDRKKQRMNELIKKQKQELSDLDKKQSQEQSSSVVDPVTALQTRQSLLSHQRAELTDLEAVIDREDAEEYETLQKGITGQLQDKLDSQREALITALNVPEVRLQKILSKHKREREALVRAQGEERQEQQERLKEQLSERRREWEARRAEETREQENLREYEENVARKLMDNQVALSEEERDKILQEHEKQMVTLENSLTLSKLQQKRMLEEKLAKKRAQQMDKLEKRHAKQLKKRHQAGDSDDEGIHGSRELELFKKQAEERMSIMRGESLKLDDELDEIRDEMVRDRAMALKEQEIRLGAMLAQIQMEKAKEMARIEDQQKAIHKLKSNLMDDLNEKGILSDPECQKVIQIHQKEQEKLHKKLDAQREKQEKMLRERLQQRQAQRESQILDQHKQDIQMSEEALRQRMQERLAHKEKLMTDLHKRQVEEAAAAGGGGDDRRGNSRASSAAVRLRMATAMTRNMVDMERFRNRMETEIDQSLEEMRRQGDMKKMAAIQQQELQFINGLVRLGKFDLEELQNVVCLLFPTKSPEEVKVLMETLLEGCDMRSPSAKPAKGSPSKGPEQRQTLSKRRSTLEERVLVNTLGPLETDLESGSLRGYGELFTASNRTSTPVGRDLDEGQGHSLSRPARQGSPVPGELDYPPTTGPKKGKKKGKLAPIRDDEDRYYGNGLARRQSPDGRYSPDGYYDAEGVGYGQVPATRLPPLDQANKKKRKKKLTVSYEADF